MPGSEVIGHGVIEVEPRILPTKGRSALSGMVLPSPRQQRMALPPALRMALPPAHRPALPPIRGLQGGSFQSYIRPNQTKALANLMKQALPSPGGNTNWRYPALPPYMKEQKKVTERHTKAVVADTKVRWKMINLSKKRGAGLFSAFGIGGGSPYARFGKGGIYGGMSGIDLFSLFGKKKGIGPFSAAELSKGRMEGVDYLMKPGKRGQMYSASTKGAGGGGLGGMAKGLGAAGLIFILIGIAMKILQAIKSTETWKFFENLFQYLVGSILAWGILAIRELNYMGQTLLSVLEGSYAFISIAVGILDVLAGIAWIFEEVFGTGHKFSLGVDDLADSIEESYNKRYPDTPLRRVGGTGGYEGYGSYKISLEGLFDWTKLIRVQDLFDWAPGWLLRPWDLINTEPGGRVNGASLISIVDKISGRSLLNTESKISLWSVFDWTSKITPWSLMDWTTRIAVKNLFDPPGNRNAWDILFGGEGDTGKYGWEVWMDKNIFDPWKSGWVKIINWIFDAVDRAVPGGDFLPEITYNSPYDNKYDVGGSD